MNRDEIMEFVGAESWYDVEQGFGDGSWTESQILAELNRMYPTDDNEDLASAIYAKLS